VVDAHPGQRERACMLKGKPIRSARQRIGSWIFSSKFGYIDDQLRHYTFSVAQFLAEPKAVQAGFLFVEAQPHDRIPRELKRVSCFSRCGGLFEIWVR